MRRLPALLRVLSSALLIVTIMMAIRSLFVEDVRHFTTASGVRCTLNSKGGTVRAEREPVAPAGDQFVMRSVSNTVLPGVQYQESYAISTPASVERFDPSDYPQYLATHAFRVSYLVPIVLFAAPPVITLVNGRHRKRLKRLRLGQCVGCGYDLKVTRDRCPECGRIAVFSGDEQVG